MTVMPILRPHRRLTPDEVRVGIDRMMRSALDAYEDEMAGLFRALAAAQGWPRCVMFCLVHVATRMPPRRGFRPHMSAEGAYGDTVRDTYRPDNPADPRDPPWHWRQRRTARYDGHAFASSDPAEVRRTRAELQEGFDDWGYRARLGEVTPVPLAATPEPPAVLLRAFTALDAAAAAAASAPSVLGRGGRRRPGRLVPPAQIGRDDLGLDLDSLFGEDAAPSSFPARRP
jgi:hypothetical protein